MTMRESDRPTTSAPTRTDRPAANAPTGTDRPTINTPERTNKEPSHRTWTAGETKGSFKTTELWAAIVGVVALIVVYNASSDLSLDLFRACLLCTVLGAAYILSRGFAKSGSRPEHSDWDDRSNGGRRN
jgi:hypothetical protein